MIIIRIKKKGIELIQGTLLILIFIITLAICGNIERHYTMEATITGIENEMIIFEDKQGHIWRWIEYEEELTEGQKVKITFFDKGTENNRKDDEIIKYKILDNTID